MTATILPFARPAPCTPQPAPSMVTREDTAGRGLSFTLTIGTEAIARAMLEAEHRGEPLAEDVWSPADDPDDDLADADGFLYADDDGPETDTRCRAGARTGSSAGARRGAVSIVVRPWAARPRAIVRIERGKEVRQGDVEAAGEPVHDI